MTHHDENPLVSSIACARLGMRTAAEIDRTLPWWDGVTGELSVTPSAANVSTPFSTRSPPPLDASRHVRRSGACSRTTDRSDEPEAVHRQTRGHSGGLKSRHAGTAAISSVVSLWTYTA